MKFFKNASIAASVAAVFSATTSVVWAQDGTVDPGTTTISTTHTIQVVFDPVCYAPSIAAESGHVGWDGWWGLYAESMAQGGVDTSGLLSNFTAVVSADVTFEVLKRGNNGATQEVTLDASINSSKMGFFKALGGGSGAGGSLLADYYGAEPFSIAYAESAGFGSVDSSNTVQHEISDATYVKGANLSEVSALLKFKASSLDFKDFLSLAQGYTYATYKEDVGFEGEAFSEYWSGAFARAISLSNINLEVNASYHRNYDAESGQMVDVVVVDNVSAQLDCGAGAFTFAYGWADVDINGGNGGIILF